MLRIDTYLKLIYHYSKFEVNQMIHDKRLRIDDRFVIKRNEKVDGNVYLDDQIITKSPFIYVMFHKPKGVLSDIREGLLDYIDIERKEDLRIMGRLDIDTTGLMILTNNTKLIKEITLPGNHTKKYLVTLKEKINHVDQLEKGVIIDQDVLCLPSKVEIIDDYHIYLEIKEGKYHQVKKMMKSIDNEVLALHRISINQLTLDIEEGKYRYLDDNDLMKLKGEL